MAVSAANNLTVILEWLAKFPEAVASLNAITEAGVLLAVRIWRSQAVFVHGLMAKMQAEGLAGALAELARMGMEQEYHRVDPTTARVILVQSGPRLLPPFSPDSSHRAEDSLVTLGGPANSINQR